MRRHAVFLALYSMCRDSDIIAIYLSGCKITTFFCNCQIFRDVFEKKVIGRYLENRLLAIVDKLLPINRNTSILYEEANVQCRFPCTMRNRQPVLLLNLNQVFMKYITALPNPLASEGFICGKSSYKDSRETSQSFVL